MMESVRYPLPDCNYATPAQPTDAIVVGALLNAIRHSKDNLAKVEKVKRQTISSAGSSEDWAYFMSKWADYKTATKVEGPGEVRCTPEKLFSLILGIN